ncbi:MAG: peptide chain release factor-like protein [Candidatus Hydrogenedentota bacterium]
MPKFGVTPKKETELLNRMARNAIHESDLEEKFIRSGGPGGQSVNRSSTCVYIKHVPSGLEVKMQKARSQALNRFYARRRLCELIEAQSGEVKTPEQRKIDRLRKQKARRKRRNRQRDVDDAPESDES